LAIRFAHFVNRTDVWMVEFGRCASLPDQPLLRTVVRCGFRGQELDSYLAIEPGVFRKIDLAHPARAKPG